MTLRRTSLFAWPHSLQGCVFAAPPVRAQQTQGPIAPKPGTPVQQAPEGTIRVRVALVSAPVVVIDAKGEPVLDLQQKDFQSSIMASTRRSNHSIWAGSSSRPCSYLKPARASRRFCPPSRNPRLSSRKPWSALRERPRSSVTTTASTPCCHSARTTTKSKRRSPT